MSQDHLIRQGFVERYCRLEDADRSFDLAFWQSQTTEARLHAAWKLVELAHRWKGGKPDELRLQRSVEAYGPISG
jgi:hypothetical protein